MIPGTREFGVPIKPQNETIGGIIETTPCGIFLKKLAKVKIMPKSFDVL